MFNTEPLEAVVAYSAFDENNIVQKYLSALKDIKPILNGNDLLNVRYTIRISIELLNVNLMTLLWLVTVSYC